MTEAGARSPFRRGIGWRLLVHILLFSSMITLILTAAQLYLDYRIEVQDIRGRFDEIGKSYLGSLGGALWSLDSDQIQLQIDGIKHLPDITYLEVREVGRPHKRQVVVTVGERGRDRVITHDFPIVYSPNKDRSQPVVIGVLHVEASLDGVYGRLAERAAAILITQGVKTFIVSSFILFLVHRVLTRHLVAISGYLRGYRLGAPVRAVELIRSPPDHPDELDDLTSALNAMSSSLAESVAERESALRQLRLQETALDRAYRHFTTQETAAKLAHEIKQPLACVSTYVQGIQGQLRAGALDAAELPVLMERIARETNRVGEIIAASQSRVSTPAERREKLDLGDALRDVFPLLRQICGDSAAAAWLEAPSPGPAVMGSRASLQQVAVNLVRNACEAMSAYPASRRKLRLVLSEDQSKTYFTVSDTGPGFSRELIRAGHALFSSTKRHGSGFGLPIAAAIMSSHGGGMELANDETGGGRVTCWLPKA